MLQNYYIWSRRLVLIKDIQQKLLVFHHVTLIYLRKCWLNENVFNIKEHHTSQAYVYGLLTIILRQVPKLFGILAWPLIMAFIWSLVSCILFPQQQHDSWQVSAIVWLLYRFWKIYLGVHNIIKPVWQWITISFQFFSFWDWTLTSLMAFKCKH